MLLGLRSTSVHDLPCPSALVWAPLLPSPSALLPPSCFSTSESPSHPYLNHLATLAPAARQIRDTFTSLIKGGGRSLQTLPRR